MSWHGDPALMETYALGILDEVHSPDMWGGTASRGCGRPSRSGWTSRRRAWSSVCWGGSACRTTWPASWPPPRPFVCRGSGRWRSRWPSPRWPHAPGASAFSSSWWWRH